MAVNEAGIAAVALFYLVILFVGIAAAWRQRKRNNNLVSITSSSPDDDDQPQETIMLAKRELSLFVGILTMTG